MRITSLDHVGLHVADVEASSRFYRDVLHLESLERPDLGFPGAWFQVGEQAIHLIGKNAGTASPPTERHFALAVDDLQQWCAQLDGQGVEYRGPIDRPDGALQLFLRDPDGHVVELLQP